MSSRIGLLAVLLLTLALTACLPAITPAPYNTPTVLVVRRTASLAPLDDFFRRCVEELPETGLVLEDAPSGAPQPGQPGLVLRWGADQLADQYAAVIGQESLALITHHQNPVQAISVEDLYLIYNSRLDAWPHPATGEIQPWAYPSEADIQRNFTQAVAGGEPFDESLLYLAPGPQEMVEAVSQAPQAIGFIPRRWLNDQVKEIALHGLEPDRLVFPVLSLSPEEPAGTERAWLLCVQEQLKQTQ